MSLQQDVNVQGPLYLNEQQLALANVLVLQGLKLSTPTRRPTRDTTDDLPLQILEHFTRIRIRESETPGDDQAQASIAVRSRSKFIAFMVNRVLTKEQVEHELKDLPGNVDYRRESPTVHSYMAGSRQREWKKYEDFQAAIRRTY